ncbi:caspase family protein [Streptomyces natalensis]|uniref:caspase family protein n=1 Tax=Streptomyces natalensis TaxID=68242 RepID=UPI00068F1697|nr:caspase family protein [Streptomyces natalensis]
MSGRRFPHGPTSRAVLIGTSRFGHTGLPDIPSVEANLGALKAALTDPAHGLLAPEHCRVVSDPSDQAAVGAALSWAVREAEDLLLVYYAGHGVLDGDGQLHLALVHTDVENIGFTAVPIELLKRHVGEALARSRVLLLDCCFSGRAVSAMAEPTNLAVGQLDLSLDVSGTYVLTSTTKTAPAHAPSGARYTAFTGALLESLGAPAALTLDEIHRAVDRTLHSRGLPRPQRRSAGGAGSLALVRGPVGTPGAVPPPPRPSAPPSPPPFSPVAPAPPPFHLGAPTPPPRGHKGGRPVVIAAAVGGALAVLLASSLVKGVLGGGGDGASGKGGAHGGQARDGSSQHTGSPSGSTPGPLGTTPGTAPPSKAAAGGGTAPAGPKVRYRDRKLSWQAATCDVGGQWIQVLDLDEPSTHVDRTGLSSNSEFIDYGCGVQEGGPATIVWNSDSPQVQAGVADSRTATAADCRAAANAGGVAQSMPATKITPGTTWCVITTENRVAKVTFTKVDTSSGGSLGSSRNPAFELTATLWDAP